MDGMHIMIPQEEYMRLMEENEELREALNFYKRAESDGRIIPEIPEEIYFKWDDKIYKSRIEGIKGEIRKKFYWYADIITEEPRRRTIFGPGLGDDWFLDRASAEAAIGKEQEDGY